MTEAAAQTDKPADAKTALVATGGAPVAIIPHSVDEAFRLGEAFAKSGLAPKTLDTPAKCMVAILAGAELGMAPFQAVQSFAVVGQRPVIWGDAIPALLYANGFKLKEWFEGEGEELVARCEVTRPDGEVVPGEFGHADAKQAKLLGKDGPWQNYPRRMMKMRARAFAARDGAADVLRGMYIKEEAEDFEPIDETPKSRKKVDVAGKLGATKAKAGFDEAAIEGALAGDKAQTEEEPAGETVVDAEFSEIPHDPETGEVTDEDAGVETESAAQTEAKGDPDLSNAPLPKTYAEGDFVLSADRPNAAGQVPFYDGETFEKKGFMGAATAKSEGVKEFDTIPAGAAASNEPKEFAYTLTADAWEGGTKPFYVDGVKKGKAGKSNGLPEFDTHVKAARFNQGLDLETGAPLTENKPAETDKAEETAAPAVDASEQAALDDEAVNDLLEELRSPKLKSWLDVKPVMARFYKSDLWKGLDVDGKGAIKGEVWGVVAERLEEWGDPMKVAEEPAAFTLWVFAQTDADAVTDTFDALKQCDVWNKKLSDDQRENFRLEVQHVLGALQPS